MFSEKYWHCPLHFIQLKTRKLILYLTLVLYLVSTWGMFSTYFIEYHRTAIHAEIRNTPSENLIQLHFTPTSFAALHFKEKGREFEWNGNMYDISSIQKTEDDIIVHCKIDHLEGSLLALLKNTHKSKFKIGFQLPDYKEYDNYTCFNYPSNQSIPTTPYNHYFTSFNPALHTPPPRIVG